MKPYMRETITEDGRPPLFRWSAAFAGLVISVALWLLFQMFGMGIGLAAIDVDRTGALRDIGIGTTVWTFASPVLAMFIGSIVAGRMSGAYDRGVGATNGLVVWALTSILGTISLVLVLSLLAVGSQPALENQAPLAPDQAQAAQLTGQVLLGAGVSMLVSLIASLIGGALGVPRRRTRDRERDDTTRTIVTPAVPPPPIVATPPAP